MSEGDFNGDKAWVCWDPEIVQNVLDLPMVDTSTEEFQPDESTEEMERPICVEPRCVDQKILPLPRMLLLFGAVEGILPPITTKLFLKIKMEGK